MSNAEAWDYDIDRDESELCELCGLASAEYYNADRAKWVCYECDLELSVEEAEEE